MLSHTVAPEERALDKQLDGSNGIFGLVAFSIMWIGISMLAVFGGLTALVALVTPLTLDQVLQGSGIVLMFALMISIIGGALTLIAWCRKN